MSTKHQKKIKATIYNKHGKILSVGFNSYVKTHPRMAQLANKANLCEKIYLHAEIAALIKVRQGKPYKIVIECYDNEGKPKIAAPCPICLMAIKMAGVKIIQYTIKE